MRVALINPIGQLGGAERVLLNVLLTLRQSFPEAEVHLIALSDGPLLAEARRLGATTSVLGRAAALNGIGESGGAARTVLNTMFATPGIVTTVWALRKLLCAFRADVVHSFGLKTHLLARLAKPKQSVLIWHVQDFYSSRRVTSLLCPWASRSVNRAIAISQAVAEDFTTLLPNVKTAIIENSVDLDRYSPIGELAGLDSTVDLPPLNEPIIRVGLVATFADWKGHSVFLHAARIVLESCKRAAVRFYVIGGPIYQTSGQVSLGQLTAISDRLGLGDRCCFVPFQPDPAAAYRRLDIVVHASTKPEPFGLVIAEAMACGRAVIVSAAGGAADLFSEGIDAFGHPPGDSQALALAILRLIHDPDLRRRIGEAAAENARRRFTIERYKVQLTQVYQDVLTERSRCSS